MDKVLGPNLVCGPVQNRANPPVSLGIGIVYTCYYSKAENGYKCRLASLIPNNYQIEAWRPKSPILGAFNKASLD